jgi:hypothetical protein
MKNISVLTILGVLLCALVFWLGGCRYPVQAVDFLENVAEDVAFLGSGEEFALPGETEAERRRRWARIKRINRQNMQEDMENVLHMDQPSKLTDRRIE